MKSRTRTICAALLGAAASTGAFAQSSVTLYGNLDTALLYTSKTLDSTTGQNAGHQFAMTDTGMTPTTFGLTGTEDLGGGLKAIFKLESGFAVTNGAFNHSNGNFFGRQAWVGLDSGYGQIKAGLQFSPFVLAVLDSDPRGFSHFGSSLINYVDNVLVTGLFNANAVSYTSPTIAGLTGSALFAFGGKAGDFQAGRQYSASLKYENGGFMLNAAFYDGNGGGTAATPVPGTVAFVGRTIGAAYRFGPVTAKAAFTSYKVGGSFSNNVYGGGLDYQVTPAVDVNGGVWVTSDRNDTHNHSVLAALGTSYGLSKATALYAQVGLVNNHGAMDTGLGINNALFGVTGTTVGANIGIHHMF
ncbi:porin [Burkholderia pseudomultivorans]|uniref:Porin n=2 Tax=Burkholderia cepacia complex TaxID=87882 RepID=A0A132EYA1_9BURK|nr:porin [Burkholderia pseudomultivorans]AIO36071.1 gram-negative porin family protein [Burkholderia cenocepacia]KVC30949.1 porin [Burkholderia pseudomultivorans]KVC31615.1 porin [Burkholderia pseudomultivorans]KVC36797.1 porin [Burkholderia pseudomultivorans]KVG65295.1 porin [Burkholderia pseudomultivorans]